MITFPDVRCAIPCGWSWAEAREKAQDRLGVASGFYVNDGDELPSSSDPLEGEVMISTRSLVAVRLVVYGTLRKHDGSSDRLSAQLEKARPCVPRPAAEHGFSLATHLPLPSVFAAEEASVQGGSSACTADPATSG